GPIPILAIVCVAVTAPLLRNRNHGRAFTFSGVAIALTVATLFLNLYPRVLVSSTSAHYSLTVTNASSTAYTLTVMTIISAVFARHASLESLTVPLVLLAVAITVRASMIWAGEGIGHRTAAALIASLRLRRLRELLARGPFGLARERTGELATLLTAGLDSLDAYFARFVPQLLVAVVAPVLIVAFVAAVDWVSALILAVTLPLIPLFATLIGRT